MKCAQTSQGLSEEIDRLGDGEGDAMARRHGGMAVSALHGTGLRRLLARAEQPAAKVGDSGSTRSIEFRTLDSHGDGQVTGGADVGGHGGTSDE